MKTIYKYPVDMSGHMFSILLPKDFKFLRISLQNDKPFIWCEIEKDADKVKTDFRLFGTGQDIPGSANYLGTYDYGPLVLHLYRL